MQDETPVAQILAAEGIADYAQDLRQADREFSVAPRSGT